jgi:Fe-S-cluster containining protein
MDHQALLDFLARECHHCGPDYDFGSKFIEATRSRVQARIGVDVGDLPINFPKVIKKLSLEQLVAISSDVAWVNAELGVGPKGQPGAWMETERENFSCTQCGKCCFLPDAFICEADSKDVARWKREGRKDILVRLLTVMPGKLYDLWMAPKTQDEVTTRCPWYRKSRKTGLCSCKIHETKPRHCEAFPITKRQAYVCQCPGWARTGFVPPEL